MLRLKALLEGETLDPDFKEMASVYETAWKSRVEVANWNNQGLLLPLRMSTMAKRGVIMEPRGGWGGEAAALF